MRQSSAGGGGDLPNGRVTTNSNGLLPQSILKDSMGRGHNESKKVRHLSNESSSSVRGVTFDKSLPCSALRSEEEREQSDSIREMGRSLRNRRTSLPVSCNTFVQRSALQQQQGVPEARGIIMDMLQNRELALDSNVVACLRAVASLLNPQQSSPGMHGFNFNELNLPRVVENPFSGEQIVISPASKPRVSNITFSTVTSATGLPTIAAEPSRPRSSNYWKPTASGGGGPSGGGGHHHDPNASSGADASTATATHPAGGNATCTCGIGSAKTTACVLHPSAAAAAVASSSAASAQRGADDGKSSGAATNRRRFSSPSNAAAAAAASGATESRRAPNQRHVSEPAVRAPPQFAGGGASLDAGDDDRLHLSSLSSAASSRDTLHIAPDLAATTAGDRKSGGGYLPAAGGGQSSLPSPFSKSPSPSVAKSPSPSVVAFIKEEPEGDDDEEEEAAAAAIITDEEAKRAEDTSKSASHAAELVAPSCSSTTAAADDAETESPPPLEKVKSVRTADGTVFDCAEIDRDATLRRITEWSFPIFHFADRHKHTVLSRLTYAIFKQANLFNIFKLSPVKFFNFFHALEARYWEIPYHNRIHAADVLHGCHYLICHPVRAFLGRAPTPDEDELDEEGVEPLSFGPLLDSAPLPIAGSMSALELMALYTAAAAHDVDHPGRTNAFLVAAEDRKAILYNDRSVLENHHAAESWRILSQAQNNFIETLDSAETKRFRYLVLEYILATDLKQHFDIIMSFNDKSAEMDLTSESDRVLVSQMLIKFADINSPAKPFALHRQWTDRICQEFYAQGDEEKRRNMPISPYMDRNEPAVAKLQDSFISHIVNPLVMALNEAGLLPILPGLEEPEVLINLKHNHQKWLIEIEEQQQALDAAAENDEHPVENKIADNPLENQNDSGHESATSNNNGVRQPENSTTRTLDVEQLKGQQAGSANAPNKPILNGIAGKSAYNDVVVDENVGRLE